MKAALALIVIYVGTFLVAIQGSSTSPVQAAAQTAIAKQAASSATAAVDPAKESDIRSLLELIGSPDEIQEAVRNAAADYQARRTDSGSGREIGPAVAADYEKKFDADAVTDQLVLLYDKHYTHDEIKGLLQFYSSPLGQKAAGENPKIGREIQQSTRTLAAKAYRDAHEETRQESSVQAQKTKTAGIPVELPRNAPLAFKQSSSTQSAQAQDQP
jgi:hypothetical protein